MIKVDANKCLGCFSCSNVCPSQNITCEEPEGKRMIHWRKCKEECDLCVEFCPAKALTLVPFDESSPESDLSFDLVACKIYQSRYATEPMLRRIETIIPRDLQVDSTGLAWVWVCPICRRNIEAERATAQVMLERSNTRP